MAGRIKHMQRSHRSHNQKNVAFAHFIRHGKRKGNVKQIRSSVFERLLNLFKHQSR